MFRTLGVVLAVAFVIWAIAAGAGFLSQFRRPMGLEWLALEASCPLVLAAHTQKPSADVAQCWLYSHTGFIFNAQPNPPAGATCNAGEHAVGTECVTDGWHSVGNHRQCKDGTHEDGAYTGTKDGWHSVGNGHQCPNGTHGYGAEGEYAMIMAAADKGFIDGDKAILESLVAFRRAGADAILTYFAPRVAKRLKEMT
jgi:hypothetical protein